MIFTRASRKATAANNNNAGNDRRGMAAAGGAPEVEEEASSHPSQRDPPPSSQRVQPPPSTNRNEPSGSQGLRAQPTWSAALLAAQELLEHPPAPEGHAAWLARIQELVNAAGVPPPPSKGGKTGQPKSVRANEAPDPSHSTTSPVQGDPRMNPRDKANATTQLPATRMHEKSNNCC